MNTKHRILIVDDEPLNVKLLEAKLSAEKYETSTAYSGEEALEKIAAAAPDLILLDIMMPEMDGYEVCRRLKVDPETREIPVIFLSALHETLDKIKAFSIGAVDYITKPFQVQEVLDEIGAGEIPQLLVYNKLDLLER